MTLDIVFKNSTRNKIFKPSFFKDSLEKAAKTLKIKKRVEVSLNLVSPEKIKTLNKKYRNKNKATDVLSFPLDERGFEKYGIIPVGDIFICPSFVAKQAKREGFKVADRMRLLSVHGFLHLMGYDHEKSEKEAEEMERLERKILKEKGA